ncbi:cytidylyltransferase domain-containing protein [Desulfovibrio litoralis]|uniref:CMP-N-acetylneuraminic acid synthetase n=1 Tax=Desulfovibrio litoralis DSM 11393 TaxID=1121455 RepID=A0A1M7RSH3_9BACT|nr:acylneuraminate cytidylyltransferase family protein [Desulfovibrio litoralis]SHN49066.1 CMP-N-acetylneuraminic acid synthetase [Desulfovibrio litoralis DSM 11393]
MNEITAILPMKGNSERVPNKNIRDFAGVPLFFHILDTLIDCKQITTILINTDSEKIADLAKNKEKVKIIERPNHLCGDTVPMNDIIAYDITHSNSEHFLQTHSTNPLLTKNSIEQSIHKYFKKLNEFDSLFSVTKWQTRFYWENGNPVNHNPNELLRTQDLPALYEENSCIYLFSKESFKAANNKRIGNKAQIFTLGQLESVDIDEEEDFILAELLAIQKKNKR